MRQQPLLDVVGDGPGGDVGEIAQAPEGETIRVHDRLRLSGRMPADEVVARVSRSLLRFVLVPGFDQDMNRGGRPVTEPAYRLAVAEGDADRGGTLTAGSWRESRRPALQTD